MITHQQRLTALFKSLAELRGAALDERPVNDEGATPVAIVARLPSGRGVKLNTGDRYTPHEGYVWFREADSYQQAAFDLMDEEYGSKLLLAAFDRKRLPSASKTAKADNQAWADRVKRVVESMGLGWELRWAEAYLNDGNEAKACAIYGLPGTATDNAESRAMTASFQAKTGAYAHFHHGPPWGPPTASARWDDDEGIRRAVQAIADLGPFQMNEGVR
jgi:hypothetical protein